MSPHLFNSLRSIIVAESEDATARWRETQLSLIEGINRALEKGKSNYMASG